MTEEEDFIRRFKALPNNAGKRRAITTLNHFLDMLEEHLDSQTPTRRESFERTTHPNPVPVASEPQPAPQPSQNLAKALPVRTAFPSPDVRARYRESLVRKIWSAGISKELVDRIVALKEAGVAQYEITAAIENAKSDYNAYVETGKGVKASWIALGRWCKAKYAALGVEWTKCSPDTEPKPEPLAPAVVVNYRDEHGRRSCVQTRELTNEQALELSDIIESEEKAYTVQEIKDRITRFAKGETVSQYRYAC